MNTLGLLQSEREALRASLTLQESRSIHDSMNIPKIAFISFKFKNKPLKSANTHCRPAPREKATEH